jgi:hypothetical protein
MNIPFLRILFAILIIFLIVYFWIKKRNNKENFYNYSSNQIGSLIHSNGNDLLLKNEFPTIKNPKISNKNYDDFWWRYPELKFSNYEQLTNNIKYVNNPDQATAIPAEFNFLFYKNIHNKSNKICVPSPVKTKKGQVRIGYFNTDVDILY